MVDPSAADGAFSLLWLVVALPALGAVVLLVGGPLTRGKIDKWGHLLGVALPVGSFLISLLLFIQLLGRADDDRQVSQHLFTWFEAGSLKVNFDLLYDPLSALFLLLITGVGSLIHIYSIGYMEHDPRRRRFFGYLNLFVAAMLMLVLSANYLGLFLGWEGVGLASYLLIGFWQHKPSAAAAAKKAFIVNRVGDIGLSMGIALMFTTFGTVDFSTVSELAGEASETTMTVLGLLLLLAACGKSAQVPLQSWLLDAMEGPTPVSALIHAATMVTAGVYLIVRSNFIFDRAPDAQTVVVVVAVVTLPVGRDHRLRQGRHQEGPGRLDDEPDRLHDARRRSRRRRLRLRDLPPAQPRLLQGQHVPRGRLGHARHGRRRRHAALRRAAQADADHLRDLHLRLPRDHRCPSLLRLLVQGQDHRGRAGRLVGRGPARRARRGHHRLLHDAPDADDLLRREALGGRCPPPRVAEGDDDPADRAGRALGAGWPDAAQRLDRRLPGPVTGTAEHVEPPIPAWSVSVLVLVVVAVGVAIAWFLVGKREVPRTAPTDVSWATNAARADLYGDAINDTLVVAPGAVLVRNLTSFDQHGVDGVVEGGSRGIGGVGMILRRTQNGYVRSYALSLLGGALLVILALLAVNFS